MIFANQVPNADQILEKSERKKRAIPEKSKRQSYQNTFNSRKVCLRSKNYKSTFSKNYHDFRMILPFKWTIELKKKLREKIGKYVDIGRELKNTLEIEGDDNINCS